jgi:hypothetical protein
MEQFSPDEHPWSNIYHGHADVTFAYEAFQSNQDSTGWLGFSWKIFKIPTQNE